MALPELDTSVGHSFGLEIDGLLIDQIQEVTGLRSEQDVIELKENTADGKFVVKKLPGRRKAGQVTLTRVLTEGQSFESWMEASRSAKAGELGKGGAIIFYDVEGTAFKRVRLENPWVKSLESGSLAAGDTSVLAEKLVLHYEALEVE